MPLKKASSQVLLQVFFHIAQGKTHLANHFCDLFPGFSWWTRRLETLICYPSRLETTDSATYLLDGPSNFVPTQLWHLPASFPRMNAPLLNQTSQGKKENSMQGMSPNLPLLIHPHTFELFNHQLQSKDSDVIFGDGRRGTEQTTKS